MPKPVAPRFIRKYVVEPTSSCWIWTGAKRGTRYGMLSVNGCPQAAHRASYELFRGPVPEGQNVLHRCDVPLCVNPDHLYLGTQVDNVRDMWERGKYYRRYRMTPKQCEVCGETPRSIGSRFCQRHYSLNRRRGLSQKRQAS